MANLYGPQLPPPKRKPAPRGPIQPAFAPEEYMGNPWSKMMNNEMPMGIPPVVQVPNAAAPPMAMPDTRLSESPFDRANIQMSGPSPEGDLRLQIDPNYNQRPTISTRVGESANSSIASEIEKLKKSTRDTFFEPGEWEDLTNTVRQTPEVKAMLEAQAARERQLADLSMNRAPASVNMAPLMALVDQWTGSKMAQHYKPPEQDNSIKTILDYQAKLQDDKQKTMETILKGASYLKSGTASDQLSQSLAEAQKYGIENPLPRAAGGGRGGRDPGSKAAQFLNTFKNIETVKKANEGLSGAKEVLGNINSPSWLTDSSVKASILKTMQLYPVSDLDASMVEGGQSVKNKAERLFLKLTEGGRFLPEDRETIKQYASVKEKALSKQIKNARSEYVTGMAPHFGYGEGEAQSILESVVPKSGYEAPVAPKGPSKQAQDITNLLKDALK